MPYKMVDINGDAGGICAFPALALAEESVDSRRTFTTVNIPKRRDLTFPDRPIEHDRLVDRKYVQGNGEL